MMKIALIQLNITVEAKQANNKNYENAENAELFHVTPFSLQP